MPTVFIINGFRFFFYSNEMHEPCHIHVVGRGGEAKFWIPECNLAHSYRLNAKDLKDILVILKERTNEIKEKWDEFFERG